MNAIRQTQQLNRRELEAAIPPSASWHADYRDTAWLYVGGFSFDLSEGDILTIFSQYGNPTHLNLIRDRETGKSKGFGFLKYEDQRSCDLAVDNLGGAKVLDRLIRVDHTRYKKRDDEDEETYRVDRLEAEAEDAQLEGAGADIDDTDDEGPAPKQREKLKEELELEKLLRVEDGEEQDPMRQYLIDEKKAEVNKALARQAKAEQREKEGKTKLNENDDAQRSTSHRARDVEEEPIRKRSPSKEGRGKYDQHREDPGRRKDRDDYRHRRRRSRSRSSSRERTRYRR